MKGRQSHGMKGAALAIAAAGLAYLASAPHASAGDDGEGPSFPRPLDGWKGSVAIADVDGDGALDVVAGAHAFRFDGTPLPGFPVAIASTGSTCPAVRDLDGDGAAEIVYAVSDSLNDASGIEVFDGFGRRWPGFPVFGVMNTKSSPAVDDVDGDGVPDIVVGATLPVPGVFAFSSDGGRLLPGFPVPLGGWVYGTPALGDVDGDGVCDILVATRYPTARVYALRGDGSIVPGWPRTVGSGIEAPATLVDVNGDGLFESFFPSVGGFVYGFEPDGDTLAGFPVYVGGTMRTAAAAGDVDLDGGTDLVVRTESGSLVILSVSGRLAEGYPRKLFNNGNSAVVLADVTGDGRPEAVGMMGPNDRRIEAIDIATRHSVDGFPMRVAGSGETVLPALVDLDGDRELDFVVASGDLEVLETGVAFVPDAAFWPTLSGTFDRVARYVDPRTRPIEAKVEFIPGYVNMSVRQRGLTLSLEFDTTATIMQLDPTSIALTSIDGRRISPIRWDTTQRAVTRDIDSNGVKELYLRFSKQAILGLLPPLRASSSGVTSDLTIGVTGRLVSGRRFEGAAILSLAY